MEERDIELLEAHLDDALNPIEVEHLRLRLAAEPELAVALETLRAERAARALVWRSMKPTMAEASSLADAAVRRGRRAAFIRLTGRHVAALLAAAACIAVGWFGRGVVAGGRAANSTGNTATALRAGGSPTAAYRVALTDSAGNVVAVQTFARPDEAQRFATDLAQWQARQQQARPGQVVSDKF
jgi:hypothetical protein